MDFLKLTQVLLALLNAVIIFMSIKTIELLRSLSLLLFIPAIMAVFGQIYDLHGPQNRAFKLFTGLNHLWNAVNQCLCSGYVIQTVFMYKYHWSKTEQNKIDHNLRVNFRDVVCIIGVYCLQRNP